ncbi:hypothetical protein GCM10018785_08120 [Streptomyces longispororuber]|uniref:Uncharacterized protein n=1 Tax=Streptomyces longispororuber TaxID=68230 RepID=A0A918Z8A3_9ACTN|nr:hypothetical protein [Streptomyces longispororuber]GHE40949.1 hypothetical protein GCM10018785_08120 [Streptomyces longispororuber]
MEPISLLLLLMAGGFAAGAVLALVTWDMVEGWVSARAVRGGYAEILSERLSTGEYHVVGGVFSPYGVRTATQVWDARALDPELARRLRVAGGVIRVHT